MIIASSLAKTIGISREIVIDAQTVKKALLSVDQQRQGFNGHICDETGQIRPYINIFVNGLNIGRHGDALLTPLHDGDLIHIFPSVAGGSQ